MAYCGVLVGVQSKLSLSGWYREATKFLQIVGRDGSLWLTLSGGVPDGSGNSPSLSDPSSAPSEENRLRALFPQSEESWRLGEGGDLLEVDAVPGNPSALHLTVRRSVFKLGGLGRSETWSFSVPCKAFFIAQLVDCGVPVPFKAGQVPGVALGPNNETDLQGFILPLGLASASGEAQLRSQNGSNNSSNLEEVTFLFEATTMRVMSRARGDTVVSFAVKDIESVGFVTDLEPGGFSITHAGYPQVHVFRAQSAGRRDAVLAGLEARALLLGRSLEPFGALELHELAPPPPSSVQGGNAFHASRLYAGSGLSGSGGHSVRGVTAQGGGASVELNLTVRTLLEVTQPGMSMGSSSNASGSNRSSNRHASSSGGMQGRALTSMRPLSSLAAVVLPPTGRPQDVVLQWASGFSVCYEFTAAAACSAFLVALLDRCAAPAAGCHGLPPPILASPRLWSLRAVPWPAIVPANNGNSNSSWILAAEAYYVHRLCAAAVDASAKVSAEAETDGTSQVANLPLNELEVFLANMPRRAPPPLLLRSSNSGDNQRISAGPVQALTSKVAGSVVAAASSVTDLVSSSSVDTSALSRCVELITANLCYGSSDGDVERCAGLCSSLVLLLGHAHAFKSIAALHNGEGSGDDDVNAFETTGAGPSGGGTSNGANGSLSPRPRLPPHSLLFKALIVRLLALASCHPSEAVATTAAEALAALLTFRGGHLPSAHSSRVDHSTQNKRSPRNSNSFSFSSSGSGGGASDPLVTDAEQRHRDILLLGAFPNSDGPTDGPQQGAALLVKALKLRASGTSHGAGASLAVAPLLRGVCNVALFGTESANSASTATAAAPALSPSSPQGKHQQPVPLPASSPRSALLAAVADNALFLALLGAGAPPAWGCAAELLMTEVTRVDDDNTARASAAALAARRAQQFEAWQAAMAQHKADQETRVQLLYVEAAQAAARTGRPPPAYNTFVENLAQSNPPSPPPPPPPILADQFADTGTAGGESHNDGSRMMVPRQHAGFRTRMQAAALRDGSFLRHLARAALGTSGDGHHSNKGNGNVLHRGPAQATSSSNGGNSGGSSTSAFLVSVWSAGSPDALALLAHCLPASLLNVLWGYNPLVPEILKASKLRAVQRLLRGEALKKDSESTDFLDDQDAETTDDENNSNDDDDNSNNAAPLPSATLGAVATWLGRSLSRRRWALLWDLTRSGQVDCPSLVWHAGARADFSRALTSQVWALDRAQAAAATSTSTSAAANANSSGASVNTPGAGKSPSSKKGAAEVNSIAAVMWNFSEFEVVYPSLTKERSVAGFSLHPLCNLKSASAVRATLSRAALTAAAAASAGVTSATTAAGASSSSSSHAITVTKFVRHFAEELLQSALLDPQPLTQRLVLSALDKVVRAFGKVPSVTEVVSLTEQAREEEQEDATGEIPADGIVINWAFPNMVSWCVKLLDATSDRGVFERCLSLLHALLHAAPLANGHAALKPLSEAPGDGRRYAYDRQGSNTEQEEDENGKSSDGGADVQAALAGALAVVASLVHRRDALSDAAALSKFAVNKRPVSAGPASHQLLPQLTSSSSSSSSLLTQSASTDDHLKTSQKGAQSSGELVDENENDGGEEGEVAEDSSQNTAKTPAAKSSKSGSSSKEKESTEEEEGVWYYLALKPIASSESGSLSCQGPCTIDQLRSLLESGAITRRTKVAPKSAATRAPAPVATASPATAPDLASFRPLSSVRQLRWTLLLQGPRTKSNAELCLVALDSLLVLATAHNERLSGDLDDSRHQSISQGDKSSNNGSSSPVVWPPPLGVLRCASPLVLPHVAQCLLAVGRPLVVDAAAKLLLKLAQVLNSGPLAACLGTAGAASSSPLGNRSGGGRNSSSETTGSGTGGGDAREGSGQLLSSGALGGPKLYTTGAFYFCLSYRGSNLQPIAQLLKVAHAQQRLPHGGPPGGVGADSEGSDKATPAARSVLRPLLPDAMLHFLANYSASAFADTFLSDADTPEAKWTPRMRFALADTVDQHLSEGLNDEDEDDDSSNNNGAATDGDGHSTDKLRRRLAQDTLFRYEFVPMPPVRYPDLERELYCQGYYLGNLCAYSARFPGASGGGWPLRQPVAFLKALLSALAKVHSALRAPPSLTNTDALRVLGFLPQDSDGAAKAAAEAGKTTTRSNTRPSAKELRKAYHALAREWHPDKNPSPTARVRFQEVQRAYEALSKDALSYEDTTNNATQEQDGNNGNAAGKSEQTQSNSSSSSDGHGSGSSAKEPHASYELRLILECHALLFAQHGALLCQYRYPSYPLLLRFFGSGVSSHETNPFTTSSSSSSSSSISDGNHNKLATCPVSWLTLVARVLLATTGGTFGKGNPGNARALCVDARGGAACALVLRRALTLVSEASTALVNAPSNQGSSNGSTNGGSSSVNGEGNAGFALLSPLLGLLCGPFAGLPDFKAFLEAPISTSRCISDKEEDSGSSDAANKNNNCSGGQEQGSTSLSGGRGGLGMGCVRDLCKCLSLASQRPELVTLVLRGLLKLLCLPPSAAVVAGHAAATSSSVNAAPEAKKVESESERCEDLGHRLLSCPGFFATLLDFLLRYDSSLPLPRSSSSKVSASPATAARAPTDAGASGAPAVEGSSSDSSSSAPLQLASNHHALLALRIFRQLASPNTSDSNIPAAMAATATGVRVALQALLPGDLACAVLGLERTTKKVSSANTAADSSDDSQNSPNTKSGVALLGVCGINGIDSQAIIDATENMAAASSRAAAGTKLEDEQCIDASEEAALIALNTPADTPLVKWTGDLQAKLLSDFCAPRVGWNAPSESDASLANDASVETASAGNGSSTLPPVLVAAASFRYSELKDEVTVKGIFLRAFVEQHKNGGGGDGAVSSEVSKRTRDDSFANALFQLLQGNDSHNSNGASSNLARLERAAQCWAVRALHRLLASPHSPPPLNSAPFGNPSHLAVVLERFWRSLDEASPEADSGGSKAPTLSSGAQDTWSMQLALRLVAHPAGARALAGSSEMLGKCLTALHPTSTTGTSAYASTEKSGSSTAADAAAGLESDGSWVQQASALALVAAACRSSDECCSQVLERGGLLDLLALAMPSPSDSSSSSSSASSAGSSEDNNVLGHKVRATAVETLSVLCNSLSFGGAAVDALSIFLPAYFVEMLLALVHKMPVPSATDSSAVADSASENGRSESSTKKSTKDATGTETFEIMLFGRYRRASLLLPAPSTVAADFLSMLDRDHANPELQWSSGHGHELRRRIADVIKMRQLSLSGDSSSSSLSFWLLLDSVRARFSNSSRNGGGGGSSGSSVVCGNIDVPLFLANPSFELRDPESFLRALLDTLCEEQQVVEATASSSAKVSSTTSGGGADTDTSDEEGPAGGAGGARAAAANARAAHLCARAVVALLEHSPDAPRLHACAASLKMALPLARVLLAPITCAQALHAAEKEATQAEALAKAAPPGPDQEQESTRAGAAAARRRGAKRRARAALRRADDAALVVGALCGHSTAVAEQCLCDPVARVASAISNDATENNSRSGEGGNGASGATPTPATVKMGVLGALATAAAPTALVPSLPATTVAESSQLSAASYAALTAAAGKERSWSATALRLRAIASLVGPMSEPTGASSGAAGQHFRSLRGGTATAAGWEEFCAQALHSGLAAICVTILESADSQSTSTSSSSSSSSSNPSCGDGGGESSSDDEDNDDENDITGGGSEASASSPAQARVTAQVHALAILQALEAASTQASTAPNTSTGGNNGGSGGGSNATSSPARTAVAALLAASDSWGRARGQRHDLMMVNASVTGYLTN